MFQSVIHPSGASANRFGAGVWVSVGLHAAVLCAALLVSGVTPEAPPPEPLPLVFMQPPRTAPRAPAVSAPTPPRPAPQEARRPARRTGLHQPRVVPPPPEPRPEAPPEPAPADGPAEDDAPPGGDTSRVGGAVCPACIVGPALTNSRSDSEEVLEFGTGMTPPQLLSVGRPLVYTAEASRAGVQGLLVARCTISREGRVDDCRIIKGLPFMEQAVIDSLRSRQYRPVTFQGKPVNALYTFNVRLRMP